VTVDWDRFQKCPVCAAEIGEACAAMFSVIVGTTPLKTEATAPPEAARRGRPRGRRRCVTRTALLTLAVPLPMRLVAELCVSIERACERAGYTDVAMLTDGTNRIVARRVETGDRR